MKNTLLTFLLIAGATLVSAQNKVYVATFGNDTNNCTTQSQPCRTWDGAIAKAAIFGNVLALDSGDFGGIDVTQPVLIDGGAHGAFATGSFEVVSIQLAVNADGPVILRNLTVVLGPAIENNEIDTAISASLRGGGLILDHVAVEIERVSYRVSSATGIQVGASSGVQVDFKDVTVHGMTRGIDLANLDQAPTAPVTVMMQNVSVAASDLGMNALESKVTIRNSSFRGATQGMNFYGPVTLPVSMLDSSQVANNGTGISVHSATLQLFNSVIAGNTSGIAAGSSAVISFRNNSFAGNGADGPVSLATSLK